MNTPTISTKLIVTFLLIAGVSACSFPEKRKPNRFQENDTQAATQQGAGRIAGTKSYTDSNDSQDDEPAITTAQEQDVNQKHSAIRVKEQSSRQYTVKKGDTLWDISSQFLKDPWFWPEIWHKNAQVENPHLIYPGDVLTLIYVNGQPQIIVEDTPHTSHARVTHTTDTVKIDEQTIPVLKLSPRIRKQGIEASVVTIPGDAIRQFLSTPRVITKEELEGAPYIIASNDEHLIMGQDNLIYVRGELDKDRSRFSVFRPGKELIDPEIDDDEKSVLGYEAIYAGEAHIKEYGDPIVGTLISTEREVLVGDRLLPVDKSKIKNLYYPRVPDQDIQGKVISLFDALFGIAKFQIAVVNRGTTNGLEIGHLLATYTSGRLIDDDFTTLNESNIKLPDERSGLIMIFNTFDRVSYGLVLESTNVINNYDTVMSPK